MSTRIILSDDEVAYILWHIMEDLRAFNNVNGWGEAKVFARPALERLRNKLKGGAVSPISNEAQPTLSAIEDYTSKGEK